MKRKITLGTIIREVRVDRGLSLRELAKKAGLSDVGLGEIERGKVKGTKLIEIAGALGMPEEVLTGHTDDADLARRWSGENPQLQRLAWVCNRRDRR